MSYFKPFFIIIVLQTIVYTRAVRIIDHSKNEEKSLGDTVELYCTIFEKGYTLMWTKFNPNHSEPFSLAYFTQKSVENERYTVKYDESSSNYSLIITDLRSTDAGYYQCQIIKSADASQNLFEEIKLDIKQPPKVTSITPNSVSVVEGQSVNITCESEGYPVPQISWEKENGDILPMGGTSIDGNTLEITNITRLDRGYYFCIAENGEEPNAMESIKVNVEFAPVVDTPRPRIGQVKGASVKLQCHVEAYPPPSVKWIKNGQVIASDLPHSSTDKFIHSHYVSVIGSADYGNYTCKVENTHGVGETVIELYETDSEWPNANNKKR